MPELPEVETIRNKFRLGTSDIPSLIGKRVTGVKWLWERTLEFPTIDEFSSCIIGQSFSDIGRRGKYLLFHLQTDTMIIHLRMSGDLLFEAMDDPIAPHHRLLIFVNDEHRLAFNDTRKFGRVWLLDDPEKILAKLGPEPLDQSFEAQDFHQRLNKHRRQLKPLILDQNFLAGVGNIYADEALHKARLHPKTPSNTLRFSDATRLLDGLRDVLNEGIHRNGASIDWVYRGGNFQNYFQVYQRTAEPCYHCGTSIERIVVGQRSSHYCPQCQPLPEG
jgi:formamidopyrimidine-DNA glycosylase